MNIFRSILILVSLYAPVVLSSAAEDRVLFDRATLYVRNMPAEREFEDEIKLTFYANFKQATVGPCSKFGGSQPWVVQYEARPKWDAWNSIGDKSAQAARADYIALLDETAPGWREETQLM
jgi:diazepam-binding inhibitor (GABA receptor modulator, acyl-CoA-binding protein)